MQDYPKLFSCSRRTPFCIPLCAATGAKISGGFPDHQGSRLLYSKIQRMNRRGSAPLFTISVRTRKTRIPRNQSGESPRIRTS